MRHNTCPCPVWIRSTLACLFTLFLVFSSSLLFAQEVPDSTHQDTTAQGTRGVKGQSTGVTPDSTRITISADSLLRLQAESEDDEEEEEDLLELEADTLPNGEKRLNPKRSALLSTVLPGAGQVYNRRLWKVPIIYGGLGAIGYFVVVNNNSYVAFKKAFAACKEDPTCTEGDVTLGGETRTYQKSDMLSNRESFRRYRDFNIIIGGVWYTFNILDAFVDAHLRYFDISDDISFQMKPKVLLSPVGNQPAFGASLSFRLK